MGGARILLLALLAITLSGCGVLFPQVANPAQAAQLRQLIYPAEAPMGEDLDIMATQDDGYLQLSNRTPRTYSDVFLWLNRQYVSPLQTIPIGRSGEMPLSRFINRHGEPFPTPGLLMPDKGFPVVSAELFDPATGTRHRLLPRQE